jgi:hypothetical protein
LSLKKPAFLGWFFLSLIQQSGAFVQEREVYFFIELNEKTKMTSIIEVIFYGLNTNERSY